MSARASIVRGFGLALALATPLWPVAAAAQTRPDVQVRPPTVEVSAGIGYVGQADSGTRDATMTANGLGSLDPLTFFSASGKTRSGPVGVGSVGINLTRSIGVEGGFQYSRPSLSVELDQDVEDTPSVTLDGAAFEQYVTEGNLVYHFNGARIDETRTVPFVLAGAGVIRQNADDGTSATGTIYQAGLGFKWFAKIARSGRAHGAGLRLDVRYVFRDGGFDFEPDQQRSLFVFTATALFGFYLAPGSPHGWLPSSSVISIIVRRKPRRANSRWAAAFRSAVHSTTRGCPRARSHATTSFSSASPTPCPRSPGATTRSCRKPHSSRRSFHDSGSMPA
jgi:hypothetical protein